MRRSLVNLMEAVTKNKKIVLSAIGWQRMKQIEREVKSRKIKPEGAVEKIKLEEKLSKSLNAAEWKNIKEQIEDIVD